MSSTTLSCSNLPSFLLLLSIFFSSFFFSFFFSLFQSLDSFGPSQNVSSPFLKKSPSLPHAKKTHRKPQFFLFSNICLPLFFSFFKRNNLSSHAFFQLPKYPFFICYFSIKYLFFSFFTFPCSPPTFLFYFFFL